MVWTGHKYCTSGHNYCTMYITILLQNDIKCQELLLLSHSGLLWCMACLTQTAPHNATENRVITRNMASTTEDNPGGGGGGGGGGGEGRGGLVALFPLIML